MFSKLICESLHPLSLSCGTALLMFDEYSMISDASSLARSLPICLALPRPLSETANERDARRATAMRM